jgi:hypothetical protein
MISLSVLRAGCVKLARHLTAAGVQDEAITAWLDAYKTDPLHETRFALQSFDNVN